MPPPIPRCSSWAYSSLISPSCFSLPRYGSRVGLHIVLFEACSTFTRVAACTLALSPIRDTLIEGFSHFVTSMTAPIASGWSGCRVGLAPTGKRRLCTAHANNGHSFRVASAIRQPTLGLTKQHRLRPTTSCWLRHVSGSAHPRIWYSSFADLTTRIDPYSVVIGSARRSEFQSKLACPLEGLRRITRRERHGSGYVR